MENVNTLDYLLQIETKAAAMVNDAQAEADRRIHESEGKNHAAFEERFRAEAHRLETSFQESRESTRKQYLKALEEYQKEISGVNVNMDSFSALLNEYLEAEG